MFAYLRQSTADQSRILGPFIDDTDFITPETGLSLANTDCKLMKNGAASVNKNSGGGTHRVAGMYVFTFDATDSDTVGELAAVVWVAGAVIVTTKFWVLEEVIYDAIFGASAAGYGTAQTGDSFARLGAPAGASVSADIAAIEAQTDDIGASVGASISADIAAVKAQTAAIETDTQDIQTKIGAPAGASVSVDIAAVKSQTAAIETDTQDIQTKIGSPAGASVSVDVAAVKAQTAAIETDTQDLQARLPAALASGRMIADVQAFDTSTASVARLKRAAESEVLGTCDAGGSSTSVIASSLDPASIVNGQFNGRIIIFAADTATTALRGQATLIENYEHATMTFTVTALTTAPASGDTFVIV